jgi:carboxymethylenebutenolidase
VEHVKLKNNLKGAVRALALAASALAMSQTMAFSALAAENPPGEAAAPVRGALIEPATPETGLTCGIVVLDTFDRASLRRPIQAYRCYPQGKVQNAPVLLFEPMIIGMCAPIHQDMVRRIAHEGFYVIMPNLPGRHHVNACTEPFDDANPNGHSIVHDMVAFPNEAEQWIDLHAGLDFAAKEGASATKIGMVGYDGGGRTAYKFTAREPKILAGVSFSGPVESNYQITIPDLYESRPSPIDLAYLGLYKGRMLGLYGDDDGQAPVAHLERMKKALVEGGDTRSKISIYPKAGHGIISDFRRPTSKPAFDEGIKWLKDHGLTY